MLVTLHIEFIAIKFVPMVNEIKCVKAPHSVIVQGTIMPEEESEGILDEVEGFFLDPQGLVWEVVVVNVTAVVHVGLVLLVPTVRAYVFPRLRYKFDWQRHRANHLSG